MSVNKDELQGHDRDAEEALAAQQPEPEPEVEEHETKGGRGK